MPLTLLLILVIGGIVGIALTLHLLGLSKPKRLTPDTLAVEWLRAFPDDTFETASQDAALVSQSGMRALLHSDQGLGLVWTMGADTAARRLDGATWEETRTGLTVRFDHPGVPRITIQLDATERTKWCAQLRNKSHA